jgi:hypothetical protein
MSRLASMSQTAGAPSKSRIGTSKTVDRYAIQEEMIDEEYGGVQYNSKIQELEASLLAEKSKLEKMQEDLKKARQERTAQAQITVANKHGQMLQGMAIGMNAIQQKQDQEKVKWEEEWRLKLQDLWQQQNKAMADFKARVDSELRAIQAEMVGNIRRRAQKAAENGGRLSPRTISKTQQDNVRVLVKLFSKHSQEKLMITNKFSRLEEALLHQRSQSQQKFAQRMHKAQQALCGRMARYAQNTGSGQLLLQPPTFDTQGGYGAEAEGYSYDQRPVHTFSNFQNGSEYDASSGDQYVQQTGQRNGFSGSSNPIQNRNIHSQPNLPSGMAGGGGKILSPLMRSNSNVEATNSDTHDSRRPLTMPAVRTSKQDDGNSSFFLTQFASEGNPLGNQVDILGEDELYSQQQYGYESSSAPAKVSRTTFADQHRGNTMESFGQRGPTTVSNVYAPFSASQRPGSSMQDPYSGQQQRPGSSMAFQDPFAGTRPGSSLPPAMMRPGTSSAGIGYPSPGSSGAMGGGFGSFNGMGSGYDHSGYDQGGPQLEMPPPPTWSTSVISFAQPAAAPPAFKKEKPIPSPYEIPQQFKGDKPVLKKVQEPLRNKTPAGAGVNAVKERERLSQKVEVVPPDSASKKLPADVAPKDPKELSSNLKDITSGSKDDASKSKKSATKAKGEPGSTGKSVAYDNTASEASRFEELERWIDSKIDRAMKVQETPLVPVGQLGEKVPQNSSPSKPITAARVLGVADEEANSPSVVSALLSRLRSTMKVEGNRDEMAAKDLNYIIPPADRDGLKGISIITSSERSQQLAKTEVKEVPQSLHKAASAADDRFATKEKRSSDHKKTQDSRSKEAASKLASDRHTDSKYSTQDDDHSDDAEDQHEDGNPIEGERAASAVGFSFDLSSSENLLSAAMAQSGVEQDESNDTTKMRRKDLDGPPGKLDPLVVNDRRAELRALELKTSSSVKNGIAPDEDDGDDSPRDGGKRPGTSSSISVKDLNATLTQEMGEGEDLLQVLFRKIRHNKVGDVEPIVNAIGNVDERDEHGNSPLMVACQNGHKRISKLLLDLGAGINVQNVRFLTIFIAHRMNSDPNRFAAPGQHRTAFCFCIRLLLLGQMADRKRG